MLVLSSVVSGHSPVSSPVSGTVLYPIIGAVSCLVVLGVISSDRSVVWMVESKIVEFNQRVQTAELHRTRGFEVVDPVATFYSGSEVSWVSFGAGGSSKVGGGSRRGSSRGRPGS